MLYGIPCNLENPFKFPAIKATGKIHFNMVQLALFPTSMIEMPSSMNSWPLILFPKFTNCKN